MPLRLLLQFFTLFFIVQIVSSQYENGAANHRYRNSLKERDEAVTILRDILKRFEQPQNRHQNHDILVEKSRIRLRNPGMMKQSQPVPYYLRNNRPKYERLETRNNGHRNTLRNRQQLFYGDFDPSVNRRPSTRPKVQERPRPTSTTLQPVKELLDLGSEDDNEIHIDGHVHPQQQITPYKPISSGYDEPIYQNNQQTESYEEDPSYSLPQQQQHNEQSYTENLENHQMDVSKPQNDESYAVTQDYYRPASVYDDNVEKKKYNLRVNLYLHNYRNGRNHQNDKNGEQLKKETVKPTL